MAKKQTFILIAIIFILTGALTLMLYLVLSGKFPDSHMQIDQSSELWEPGNTPADAGQIKIPGYETIAFRAGDTEQEITLYNPQENTCYFRFSLYIDEEKTPVYESNLVEPGSAIQKIALNQPLPEGDYQLNIHIDTYDITTGQPLNSAISTAGLSVQ